MLAFIKFAFINVFAASSLNKMKEYQKLCKEKETLLHMTCALGTKTEQQTELSKCISF